MVLILPGAIQMFLFLKRYFYQDYNQYTKSVPKILCRIEFPVVERRPIIGMTYIPANISKATFPCAGLLVQTLGSVWFFESKGTEVVSTTPTQNDTSEPDPVVSSFSVLRRFQAHKLPIDGKLANHYKVC